MIIKPISAQRVTVVSSRPFADVVAKLHAAIAHPVVGEFVKKIASAKSWLEVESIVREAFGKADFMEFARFDFGTVLQKDRADPAPKSLRLIIGNPLIMKRMVEHVPDAGSYAPVTILIDERADGVHLTYDRVASLLDTYTNHEVSKTAAELDAKVEALMAMAAA